MFQTIPSTLNFLEALNQLLAPGQFGEYQVICEMMEGNWLLGQSNTVLRLPQTVSAHGPTLPAGGSFGGSQFSGTGREL